MHKVISINLNGNAYQVDESGYNALCAYLDGADAQLRDNPDRTEIMADLEQAIGEKCQKFLRPHKTIVTAAEIDQIIQEMGPVDAAAGGDSQSGGAAHDPDRPSESTRKRLYRLREGKMVSGVCKGLGAYLGVDATIVRIVFLALALFTHGVWGLFYILLTFVIPYAQTSEEHAAAFGMPFNSQDFINQAKEHYGDFKQEGKNWRRRARQQKQEWQQAWRRTMRSQGWGGPGSPGNPAHFSTLALLPLAGIIVGVGILSLVWMFAFTSFVTTGFIFGWPVPANIPTWLGILVLIGLVNVVTGPLRFARRTSYYTYGGPYSGMIAVWSALLWTGLMIFGIWIAYNHVAEVHYFIQNLPNVWGRFVN